MKVILKSNIKLDKDSLQLDGSSTLKDLLEKLSEDIPFLHPDKIFNNKWVVISLNQKEISLLPQGMGTVLKDNDQMEIAIASFSGGELP